MKPDADYERKLRVATRKWWFWNVRRAMIDLFWTTASLVKFLFRLPFLTVQFLWYCLTYKESP